MDEMQQRETAERLMHDWAQWADIHGVAVLMTSVFIIGVCIVARILLRVLSAAATRKARGVIAGVRFLLGMVILARVVWSIVILGLAAGA